MGVFSVRGCAAVELSLQNGMKVLIGSQRPEILLKILESQLEKNRQSQ